MRRALGLDGPATPLGAANRTGTAQPNILPRSKPSLPSQGAIRAGNAPSRSEPTSPLRQRLAALEQQLAEEEVLHHQSRHHLAAVQRGMTELQARVQRTALDHADELAAECEATMRAQRELDDLLFERDRLLQELPPLTAPAAPRPEPVVPMSQPPASSAGADAPPRPPRGRPRRHAAPEPKPVRWWTASYRAEIKGKR